jgi:2',3'-cyclic-nucleotide 2'-phosphodiesterase / 3'-nucleotidase
MADDPIDPPPADGRRLRLLATTDVHMTLLGHDYVADSPGSHAGLCGLATLAARAREDAAARGAGCLLVDNGDLLQGNALASWQARQAVGPDHPLVRSLNAMAYDALGVGNHDLDFGLDYLRAVAARLKMPVLCANLSVPGGTLPLRPWALARVALPGAGNLRVGLVSVLPEETASWNRHVLPEGTRIEPARDAIARAIPAMRAAGAELIVLLAHFGIGGAGTEEARGLAGLPGIDAVVAGHTHLRLPGPDHAGLTGVDADRGLLGDRPAVMPGANACDLAVLDLDLARRPGGGWQVAGHTARLVGNHGGVPPETAVLAACTLAHEKTRARLAAPVGRISGRLHNYFALAAPTATCALTARAKARVVRAAVAGTPDADLPLLAGAPAHSAGGREGPGNFIDIPPGEVLRRHVVALSPHANHIWAVRITGAGLCKRLEEAARVFALQREDASDQLICDLDVPSFTFDTIYGASCRIDPRRPPGQRIVRLEYEGQPVEPDQRFLLATSQFRAGGDEVALRSAVPLTRTLTEAIADPADPWPPHLPWQFADTGGMRAVFRTAPAALDLLDEIAPLSPEPLGIDDEGFARVRVTVGGLH